ncbi:hypothetical protein [Kitasatospora mediocidica]|uniref:hypothetical protein n=1 Tax=Kitasatospora mediocidica TaxID=58352 RepID=UPI00055C9FA4|nr:hypothetical protein [Kitasatospora mediocidica]
MNMTPNPSDDDLYRLLDACGLKTLRPCGTSAAYARHRRHGETPCEPCRLANREAQRRLLDAEHDRLRPIKHGTTGGWHAHQYRREAACGACARAYRAYQRDRYAARKNQTTEAA